MQEKTKKKTIIQTVYVAVDGTEFHDKYDCINYENDLRRQEKENSVEDLRLDVLNDWPDVAGPEQDIEYLYFRINYRKILTVFVPLITVGFGPVKKSNFISRMFFAWLMTV